MKIVALAAAMLLSISPITQGQISSSTPGQGRSMVVTKFGIVAAPQFLASQAGAHILEEGGNAIDAAIAANAVMGVVQPYVNGIGGDLFVLYYEAKTGKLYGLNSSGWTPKALTIDYLKAQNVDRDQSHRRRNHRRSRRRRRVGCIAHPLRHSALHPDCSRPPSTTRKTDSLSPNATRATGSRKDSWISPATKRPTTHLAYAPKPGDLFKNPALANSLRQVAEHGRDAFYNGPMTDTMVKFLQCPGRHAHPRRLRDFQPEWVDPSPPPTAAGPSTSCRPTAKASPRSPCSTSWSTFPWRNTGITPSMRCT